MADSPLHDEESEGGVSSSSNEDGEGEGAMTTEHETNTSRGFLEVLRYLLQGSSSSNDGVSCISCIIP